MFERLRPCLRLRAPASSIIKNVGQTRWLHRTREPPPIPKPRPFIPDVHTFLTLIGRGLNKHASKFPTWESLFALGGRELKQLGIEPIRQRRYLLRKMNDYREGNYGAGGDFEFVKDGEAILRIALPPADEVKQTTWCVNAPHPDDPPPPSEVPTLLCRPRGYKVKGGSQIAGPFVRILKGKIGSVKVTEGMWEDKQAHKLDGGERRRAEVRFKKRSAERRAQREAEILAKL